MLVCRHETLCFLLIVRIPSKCPTGLPAREIVSGQDALPKVLFRFGLLTVLSKSVSSGLLRAEALGARRLSSFWLPVSSGALLHPR